MADLGIKNNLFQPTSFSQWKYILQLAILLLCFQWFFINELQLVKWPRWGKGTRIRRLVWMMDWAAYITLCNVLMSSSTGLWSSWDASYFLASIDFDHFKKNTSPINILIDYELAFTWHLTLPWNVRKCFRTSKNLSKHIHYFHKENNKYSNYITMK